MILRPHRRNPLWLAFALHRFSGLALAVFLPVHFYVLGLALDGAARLDGFLVWSDRPLVKIAEAGLIFLLAVHMFGGLRLIALEWLPWNPRQKTLAAAAAAIAAFIAGGFLLNLV